NELLCDSIAAAVVSPRLAATSVCLRPGYCLLWSSEPRECVQCHSIHTLHSREMQLTLLAMHAPPASFCSVERAEMLLSKDVNMHESSVRRRRCFAPTFEGNDFYHVTGHTQTAALLKFPFPCAHPSAGEARCQCCSCRRCRRCEVEIEHLVAHLVRSRNLPIASSLQGQQRCFVIFICAHLAHPVDSRRYWTQFSPHRLHPRLRPPRARRLSLLGFRAHRLSRRARGVRMPLISPRYLQIDPCVWGDLHRYVGTPQVRRSWLFLILYHLHAFAAPRSRISILPVFLALAPPRRRLAPATGYTGCVALRPFDSIGCAADCTRRLAPLLRRLYPTPVVVDLSSHWPMHPLLIHASALPQLRHPPQPAPLFIAGFIPTIPQGGVSSLRSRAAELAATALYSRWLARGEARIRTMFLCALRSVSSAGCGFRETSSARAAFGVRILCACCAAAGAGPFCCGFDCATRAATPGILDPRTNDGRATCAAFGEEVSIARRATASQHPIGTEAFNALDFVAALAVGLRRRALRPHVFSASKELDRYSGDLVLHGVHE
ncbi:hypothetical protein DFH06DRAFT_1422310, partial [Mycena polygramma]